MQKSAQSSIVVGLVVSVAGVATLAARHQPHPAGLAVQVYAAIDVSNSVRQPLPGGGTLMGRSIACLARLGAQLDSSRDRLSVSRVERDTQEFYDDLAPEGREKFQWTLIDQTRQPAAQDGTFPAIFWTNIARRATQGHRPIGIVYLGDADNDDLTSRSQTDIQAAAKMLAGNPRVADVSFLGASPKNWAKLRDEFGCLGDRLHLHSAEEMNPGSFIDDMDQARQR